MRRAGERAEMQANGGMQSVELESQQKQGRPTHSRSTSPDLSSQITEATDGKPLQS